MRRCLVVEASKGWSMNRYEMGCKASNDKWDYEKRDICRKIRDQYRL